MSRHNRPERLEVRYPGPRELDIGDGKKILTTVEDRFEMLISAIRGEDHPMLDAVRSGKGNPTPDPFTRLLRALEGYDESMSREDEPAD